MTSSITPSAFWRAGALSALGALSLLAACADDPTRPSAAGVRDAQVVPRAGITIIPVYSVSVTDLGTLGAATSGLNQSKAFGINDSGYVTGGSTRTGFSTAHDNVFRWHTSTGMLYGGLRGTGRDINLSSTITGETYFLPGGINGQAFSLSAGGVPTGLGFWPNCFESWAVGINDAGHAVGQSRECYPDSTGWFRAGTRWDPWGGKSVYTLGSSYINRISSLFDINNAMQVVGSASDSGGLKVGFRYTPGAGYELIKPWSTTVGVNPQAINASGTVAGYETGPFGTFPFRWSPAIGFNYLGGTGKAFGISASGYAVGYSDSAPVFWKSDGTRLALPRLAGAAAVPCAEWECSAQDVNGKLEIVGYDRTAGGEIHAVLWRVKIYYKIIIKLYPFEPFRPLYWGVDELIPVAVLGTPDFDPRQIKPGILRLGNDDGSDTPVARDEYGRPMVSYQDVDKDGDLDLLLYFSQAAMEKNRDLTPETTVLYLTGDLGGGESLRGVTRVEVVRQ